MFIFNRRLGGACEGRVREIEVQNNEMSHVTGWVHISSH